MLILLGLIIWAYIKSKEEYADIDGLLIAMVIVGIIFFIVLMACLVSNMDSISFCKEFEALKKTCDVNRDHSEFPNLENVSLIQNIIEANQELATLQYWQKNLFTSWFVSPKVQSISPIY